MTININTTSLEELKTLTAADLKTLAKELKVKNWWNLKKADLITELTNIKLDLEDKAAVQKANEEYQEELKKKETQETNGEVKEKTNEEAKKTQEAQAKKKAKAAKVEKNEENLVTLKELAAEFHMKGTKARRLLRDAAISRPYGGNRWEWDKNLHVDELNMAREYLGAHTKAPKKEQDK